MSSEGVIIDVRHLFRLLFTRRPVCCSMDYGELGVMTDGYVMSDIRAVVETCLRSAARLREKVRMIDVVSAIGEHTPSVSSQDMNMYLELSQQTDDMRANKIGFSR